MDVKTLHGTIDGNKKVNKKSAYSLDSVVLFLTHSHTHISFLFYPK